MLVERYMDAGKQNRIKPIIGTEEWKKNRHYQNQKAYKFFSIFSFSMKW